MIGFPRPILATSASLKEEKGPSGLAITVPLATVCGVITEELAPSPLTTQFFIPKSVFSIVNLDTWKKRLSNSLFWYLLDSINVPLLHFPNGVSMGNHS